METRFDDLFARMESKFDGVNTRIDELGARMDSKFDEVNGRLDAKFDAVNARFDRWLRWIFGGFLFTWGMILTAWVTTIVAIAVE